MIERDLPLVTAVSPQMATLAGTLEQATFEWLREIGDVDDDLVVWQPFEGGPSIGTLIMHLADCEAYWNETVAAKKPRPRGESKRLMAEEINQYALRWPAAPREPFEWFMEQHRAIRKRTLEVVGVFEDPEKVIERRNPDRRMTLRWIVTHVAAHESYHGGQAVFLKLLRSKSL